MIVANRLAMKLLASFLFYILVKVRAVVVGDTILTIDNIAPVTYLG